ncbi:MAG TPA: glycosyltransferase [Tepidisphaeraceae bacterium]|jgi:glycosyltransferase involved in cell wall biosynthesis
MIPIAIIANAPTPYREHVHRRIAAEIPQVLVYSVFTHELSNTEWRRSAPSEIKPVFFGNGQRVEDQSALARQPAELWKAGRIIHWLKENGVRLVLMGGYNDAGRVRIMRWCRRHGVPCLLCADSNVLGDTAKGMRLRVKRILVGRIMRWCKGVMVCGRLGREYFLKYGARPERIFLFPYEPDYRLIQEVPESAIREVRSRFDLPDERRRIVYSGRLIARKRVEFLIDAFNELAERRPEWDLLLIGDGPLRSVLEARVPEALRGRVTWAGFLDDQRTVSALYRSSDVLVLPSDLEPWAVVINEAAAAGMAIVASDIVGAAAELVRDGVNGRIFRHGDGEHLRQCLLDVTDPNRIDKMKSASESVLAEWRTRADPVEGLRQAMRFCGVLPPVSS